MTQKNKKRLCKVQNPFTAFLINGTACRVVSQAEKQTYSCKDEEEIHKVYWKSMVTKKMTANPYVNDI